MKTKNKNRIWSLVLSAILSIEQIAFAMPVISKAATSANHEGSVPFPSVSLGSESARLNHDDTLVDNGDGTFTFTSKITADYSYSDVSESRLKSTDGEYPLNKAGTYLIELWGGDGGDGGEFFPLSFLGGAGGAGGFVYGTLNVTEDNGLLGKKLVYEIGSKGENETRSVTGGGTNGVGGGAGDIAVFQVGAGGGHSSLYLVDYDFDIQNPPPEDADFRNDPSKVLMIAGGGGGGGAGASLHSLNFLSTILGGEGKANGGDGGYSGGSLSGTPSIGNFNTTGAYSAYVGTYYAGENGSTSGTKGSYVGQGGTDKPGEVVKTFIGILENDNYANDWQQIYQPNLARGVGGAGNFRGGGGGAGFAGATGGFQNEPLDGRNVGGGGGGSSYIANGQDGGGFTGFYPLDSGYAGIEGSSYFVDRKDNDNNAVGGAVVIRYLPTDADYSYLENVNVSCTVSSEFVIDSFECSNSVYNTGTKKFASNPLNDNDSTPNGIRFTGSVKPVVSGIRQGQEQDYITLTLKLRPTANFKGGNDVPIFAYDGNGMAFTCTSGPKNCQFMKSGTASDDFSVSHVNVPFCYKIEANSFAVEKGTEYVDQGGTAPVNNIIKDYAANADRNDYTGSISPPYVTAAGGTVSKTDFSADYGTKGIYNYDAVLEVTPTTDGTNSVGTPNPSPTYLRARSVVEVIDGEPLDGFIVKASKSLAYNDNGTADDITDDTYDFTVDLSDVASQSSLNKSFSINQAIPSVKVLDLSLNNSNSMNTPDINSSYVTEVSKGSNTYQATLAPGIYYVEAWGGDGGNGYNAPSNLTAKPSGTVTYGGYGGKGGYINGYVVLDTSKSINITLGNKGDNSTSDTTGAKGGKATKVWIDQNNLTDNNASLIAGGGGGGTCYHKNGATDQNGHMGFCGNDGYREDGSSAYLGIPTDNWYGTPSTNSYYKTDSYDGDNGENISISLGRRGIANFNNSKIEDYFAKGGYSKIGADVSSQLSITNSEKLFITGIADVDANLGLYEYPYYLSAYYLGWYVSQWTNDSGDTPKYNQDDNFQRISHYKGTTKTGNEIKNQKSGAVRITRLGVYGGHDYGSIATNTLTDTSGTLSSIVNQIKTDYTAEYGLPFTVTSNFSEYFDLVEDTVHYTKSADSVTGNDVGTYEYYFTDDDVTEVSHNQSSPDTTTYPGYSVVTDNYSYGLSGSGSVTFKLKPKSNLVGGNDIPLLNVYKVSDITNDDTYMAWDTTEVSLQHTDSYAGNDPDTIYLKRNNATDWVNVAINKDCVTATSPADPIIVDYGDTEIPGLNNIVTFAVNNANSEAWDYSFVQQERSVASGGTVTRDCKRTVIGTLRPHEAEKAITISPVSAVTDSAEADIKVSYNVHKTLTHIEQDGSAQYISGDNAPANIVTDINEAILSSSDDKFILDRIGDAYVLNLKAASGYDLPDGTAISDKIKVLYDGGDNNNKDVPSADISKKDGVITITIPAGAFTQNLKITAEGVERTRHKLYYYYEYYDTTRGGINTEKKLIGEYYTGDVLPGNTADCYSFAKSQQVHPASFENTYGDYVWDWPIEKDNNGDYVMGESDIYVVGTYTYKAYKMKIVYESADPGFTAPATYYSPDRTEYDNVTNTFDIALTAGTEFYRRSPEVEGYVPDKAFISANVTDDYIANELTDEITDPKTSKTYKGKTEIVTYAKISEGKNLFIYFVECDIFGNLTGDSSVEQLTVSGTYNESTTDIAAALSSKVPTSHEIFAKSKIVDETVNGNTVFKEVVLKENEEISGDISTEGSATYYVYYRPIPPKVTVKFYDKLSDETPVATKTCVIGREYGYNADTQTYDSMPRAARSNERLVGWQTEDGEWVTEESIVEGSNGDTVKLYGAWESLDIIINVAYKYAYNITGSKTPGADIPPQDFEGGSSPPGTITVKYGMSYTIGTVANDTLTVPEHLDDDSYSTNSKISEVAFGTKTEEVFYSNNTNTTPSVTLTVNVYSNMYEDGVIASTPKLTGGAFELWDTNGNQVGPAMSNTDGSISWTDLDSRIATGHSYIIKCTDPPTGFGTAEIPVTLSIDEPSGSGKYSANIFLDKSPFQLPMAGSKPMTGYTVFGISAMLLAGLLMFAYVNRRTEENNENE
ncbi:glycine-rich protein [Ruminococcus flavefaciens]|uniref:glycine-rich protein n=1 Tax=Ruminococcus flavefaciens TaxID=1265 RepID=UPI0026EA7C61|nr:glycine-rich protein [Ruminococcus flavefaciens]